MDERIGAAEQAETGALPSTEEQALEFGEKAGVPYTELLGDGSVSIGDGCVIIKQTPDGKLGLTIQPTKCGKATGKALLDFLVNTAGQGVVIEIPPAEKESAPEPPKES